MKQMQTYRRRRVGCAPCFQATDDELVRRRNFRGGSEHAERNHRRFEFDAHAVRRNKRALLAARFLLRIGLVVIAIPMIVVLVIDAFVIDNLMLRIVGPRELIAMMRAVAVVMRVTRLFALHQFVMRIARCAGV